MTRALFLFAFALTLVPSMASADERYTVTFVDLTGAQDDPIRDAIRGSIASCGRPSTPATAQLRIPMEFDRRAHPTPAPEECSVVFRPLESVGAGGSVELVRAMARGERNAAAFVTPGRTDAFVVYDRTPNGNVVVTVLSERGARWARVQRRASQLEHEQEPDRVARTAMAAIRRRSHR